MCSYCGCEAIELIGQFMAEHVDIVNATGALRQALRRGDVAAAAAAAGTVAALLHPHTRREEEGLFRVLARTETFGGELAQLRAEHTDLDALLAAVASGELAPIVPFIDRLREHVNREENGLFPAAAIALDGPDWEELAVLTPTSATR